MTTLRGRVIDDLDGCGVSFCMVTVAGTRLAAHSDTLGYFVFKDVPVGTIGLDGCAPNYLGKHQDVVVPGKPVVLRLRRDPRLGFIGVRPCR